MSGEKIGGWLCVGSPHFPFLSTLLPNNYYSNNNNNNTIILNNFDNNIIDNNNNVTAAKVGQCGLLIPQQKMDCKFVELEKILP